jgi:hypothetical protein
MSHSKLHFCHTYQKHVTKGHKHIKPPKNYSHKYNLFVINFFGNVWTSHPG